MRFLALFTAATFHRPLDNRKLKRLQERTRIETSPPKAHAFLLNNQTMDAPLSLINKSIIT